MYNFKPLKSLSSAAKMKQSALFDVQRISCSPQFFCCFNRIKQIDRLRKLGKPHNKLLLPTTTVISPNDCLFSHVYRAITNFSVGEF